MRGYLQFSFWISITHVRIYISCIVINRGKNIFELEGTVLKLLNPKKTTGGDDIPAWLPIEETSSGSRYYICKHQTENLIILYMSTPLLARFLKLSNRACMNSDYRQISVLPQMAKILGRIQFLINGKNLGIRPKQHAFTKDRSTVSALADVTRGNTRRVYRL